MTRFVISGAHSTGKTTLVRNLSKTLTGLGYDVTTIGEVARRVIAAGHPLNQDATVSSYLMYLAEQLSSLRAAGDAQILLSDRFLIDLLAYVETNANDSLPRDLGRVIEHVAWLEAEQYAAVFYLPVEFPMVDDGVRDTDPVYRAAVDRTLQRLLREAGRPIIELRGTVEERVVKASAEILQRTGGPQHT